ncbi:MAG: DUF3883 domain-containing protein [Acidimicrobiaceae bacterium]|nr:DUF3883 domain-containing protein [Acidimicrobiaceae bacterium]
MADGTVRFSHFGEPFTEQDVRAICGIGEGLKADDLTVIGRFGIGFKSVYAVTDLPEVHSSDEHFAIENYVHPVSAQEIALARGQTVFMLPLRDGDHEAANEVAAQLKRLGPERALLFLREINEIEWSVEQDLSGRCCRSEEPMDEGVRRVRLLNAIDGEEPLEETWLIFSRRVNHGGEPAGCVELAFKIELDPSERVTVEAVSDSRLAAFFPTEIPTRLGMLVQGPFRTTPGRDNIPSEDAWNRYLVQEAAVLLLDTLRYLRDKGILSAQVFEAFPINRSHFAEGSRFAPLFDALHEAVSTEPLLPAFRGGYVAASRARLAGNPGLRSLLSRHQLARLLDEDDQVAWLANEITERTAPALYRYLTDEQGVEEIDTSELLRLLTHEDRFLPDQEDKWVRKFYSFLHRQRVQRRHLWQVRLIRLEDGRHVAPGLRTRTAVFLPTEPSSGFPNTVSPSACASRAARGFLKSIGVSEPDLVDELERNLLPKYRNREAISDLEYYDDLHRIAGVFRTAPKERREQLIEILRVTPFVRAVNEVTDELQFVQASGVYLRTNRLASLFDGVPVWFPTDTSPSEFAKDIERLLKDCGASTSLAPIDIDGQSRFSRDERRQMRQEAGEVRSTQGESLTDSEFRGLRPLLGHLSSLAADAAAAKSELLWDALRERAAISRRPGFTGRYEWYFYKPRHAQFDSAAVQLLNQEAWVPDESGRLRPPDEVEFEALGWTRDSFLESIIRFRQPEPVSQLNAFLTTEGVTPEAFGALKEAESELGAGAIVQLLNDQVRRVRAVERPIDTATTTNGTAWPAAETGNASEGVAKQGTPDEGGSANEGMAGGKRVFESYIRVEQDGVESEEGAEQHQRRMDIEEAAIARILEQEPSLSRTPPNNRGYDLFEAGEDGAPVRWIEVKALSGTWDSSPVTLSHAQFDLAQEKGDCYWLYVVEHSGTDWATTSKIRNPAGRASRFAFDRGWRVVADPAASRR